MHLLPQQVPRRCVSLQYCGRCFPWCVEAHTSVRFSPSTQTRHISPPADESISSRMRLMLLVVCRQKFASLMQYSAFVVVCPLHDRGWFDRKFCRNNLEGLEWANVLLSLWYGGSSVTISRGVDLQKRSQHCYPSPSRRLPRQIRSVPRQLHA